MSTLIVLGSCAWLGWFGEENLEFRALTPGVPLACRSWLALDARDRLIVAKKLSKAVALSAGEGEERGMQRAAAAAGLEWDGDVGHRWAR